MSSVVGRPGTSAPRSSPSVAPHAAAPPRGSGPRSQWEMNRKGDDDPLVNIQKSGDFPFEHGDFPMKNCDLYGKHTNNYGK